MVVDILDFTLYRSPSTIKEVKSKYHPSIDSWFHSVL
jgi:hypothetical protein